MDWKKLSALPREDLAYIRDVLKEALPSVEDAASHYADSSIAENARSIEGCIRTIDEALAHREDKSNIGVTNEELKDISTVLMCAWNGYSVFEEDWVTPQEEAQGIEGGDISGSDFIQEFQGLMNCAKRNPEVFRKGIQFINGFITYEEEEDNG